MRTFMERRRPIVLEHEDQLAIEGRLAQLRHLYTILKADPTYTSVAEDSFGLGIADGLLAPQIEAIEAILTRR